MLKIETNEWYFGKKIKISDDNKAFEILFGGNGDLYFIPIISRMDLFESNESIYFNVSKDDGFLYDSFENLYNKISAYDPFDYSFASSFKEKEYQKKRLLKKFTKIIVNQYSSLFIWYNGYIG